MSAVSVVYVLNLGDCVAMGRLKDGIESGVYEQG